MEAPPIRGGSGAGPREDAGWLSGDGCSGKAARLAAGVLIDSSSVLIWLIFQP
jgi:hypothetical protein